MYICYYLLTCAISCGLFTKNVYSVNITEELTTPALQEQKIKLRFGYINESPVDETPPADLPSTRGKRERILTGSSSRTKRTQFVELRTTLGIAVGTVEISDGLSVAADAPGRRYYAFRGIPYAKPPVGNLRWSDPVDLIGPWEGGRLDNTRFKSYCAQYNTDSNTASGNEDCLYLNVFTPFLPERPSSGLPVLVFIHGGAYIRGSSSSHGAGRLLREDIVVVTINYRLGIFGFLSTNEWELPGNYGVLDQISALKWVKNHIAEFGGDPSSVTLGGFSAGASFVHLHLLSPLSRGLFHKAIIMSGAGNCLWSVQADPWSVAEELGSYMECSTTTSTYLKDCLLLKDTESLIKAQANMHRYVYWPFPYRPIVDVGLRDAPFLPLPVSELVATPSTSQIPVLLGGTPEEGLLFALTTIMFSGESSSPNRVYEEALPYIFESIWPNETSRPAIARSITSFYFTEYSKDDVNTLVADLTEAMTDVLFTSCIWDAASSLTYSKGPIYTYLMTHHDPDSISFASSLYKSAASVGVTSPLLHHGVSHGDEMSLLFNFPYSLGGISSRDQQMSSMLTSMWASFIKTGSPQDGSAVASRFPRWTPLTAGKPITYYRLSLNPVMIERPFRHKERNFWRQTLLPLESAYNKAYIAQSWEIATWCLILLVVLIVLLALIAVLVWRNSRRKKTLSKGLPTLQRQTPRQSPMRERL